MTTERPYSRLSDKDLGELRDELARQAAAVEAEIATRWQEYQQRLRAERDECERRIREIPKPVEPANAGSDPFVKHAYLPGVWPKEPDRMFPGTRIGTPLPNKIQIGDVVGDPYGKVADAIMTAAGFEIRKD